MIVNDNITTYIHSLEKDGDPFLEGLREYAEENGVPIIRREMESFIKVLLEMKKPKAVLEVGAAICYSTIFMAKNTDDDCKIITMENYEPRIAQAKENIKQAKMEEKITLMEGDAVKFLSELEGQFDFIFLDAAKGQYITMLPDLLRLLPKGGILLADNILQEGDLVRSRYATPRRQRTIHDRMREFIWEIKHTDQLETSVITIGDGVTLSIKK